MTFLLTLACTVLMAGGLSASSQAATPLSGDLRWVRGAVVAVSPASLTLKLGDGVLTLSVDASTEVITARPAVTLVPGSAATGSLAVGSLVQAHYLDRQGKRAVVIIVDDSGAPWSLAKRAGSSVRGELKHVKSRTVSIRIDRRSRDIVMDDRTTLVDRDGHVRASGAKAITAVLPARADLLVTWAPYWVMEGDGSVTSYYLNAIEIRTLTTEYADVDHDVPPQKASADIELLGWLLAQYR